MHNEQLLSRAESLFYYGYDYDYDYDYDSTCARYTTTIMHRATSMLSSSRRDHVFIFFISCIKPNRTLQFSSSAGSLLVLGWLVGWCPPRSRHPRVDDTISVFVERLVVKVAGGPAQYKFQGSTVNRLVFICVLNASSLYNCVHVLATARRPVA